MKKIFIPLLILGVSLSAARSWAANPEDLEDLSGNWTQLSQFKDMGSSNEKTKPFYHTRHEEGMPLNGEASEKTGKSSHIDQEKEAPVTFQQE